MSMFSPISEGDQSRIEKCVQDLSQEFLTTYTVQFAVNIAKTIKLETNPADTDPFDQLLLEKAPPDSDPLKTGMLTKLGDVMKNWKKRYFVVMNEQDNYEIRYYDGNDDTGKLKGTINAACYDVAYFSEEDEAQFGLYGLKLIPSIYSRFRRTWYLKGESEDDIDSWRYAFLQACWYSKGLHNPDKCIADAFEGTLAVMRRKHGYWWWYRAYSTETQRLQDFMTQVVGDEVTWAIVDSLEPGMLHWMKASIVSSTVTALTKSAVSTSWATVESTSGQMKPKLEEIARNSIVKLFEFEAEIKAKIISAVEGNMNPFIEKQGPRVFQPLLDEMIKPICDAFVIAFRGIKEHVSKKDQIKTPEDCSRHLRTLIHETYSQRNGHLKVPKETLWLIFNDPMVAQVIVAILPKDGFTLLSLRQLCMDSVKELSRRFVSTVNKLNKENPEVAITKNIETCLERYIKDAIFMTKHIIFTTIFKILQEPIDKEIIPACKTLTDPIQEAIDTLCAPIPGLNELLNLEEMLNDVLKTLLKNGINKAIRSIDTVSPPIIKVLEGEVSMA